MKKIVIIILTFILLFVFGMKSFSVDNTYEIWNSIDDTTMDYLEELGIDDMKVIATGGLGKLISENTDVIDSLNKEITSLKEQTIPKEEYNNLQSQLVYFGKETIRCENIIFAIFAVDTCIQLLTHLHIIKTDVL